MKNRILSYVLIAILSWGVCSSAQTPPSAEKKSVRYGKVSITGYKKIKGELSETVNKLTVSGKDTVLTSEDELQDVELKAPLIIGNLGKVNEESDEVKLISAKAEGGVNCVIKQKDKEGKLQRTLYIKADVLDYDSIERVITLTGNIILRSDKPKVTQTASKGTIKLLNDSYEVEFEDGTTELKPEE